SRPRRFVVKRVPSGYRRSRFFFFEGTIAEPPTQGGLTSLARAQADRMKSAPCRLLIGRTCMLRFLLIASLVLVGCSRQNQRVETAPAAPVAGNSAAESPHRIEARHLPNPVQVHPKVISGGVPEGDEA